MSNALSKRLYKFTCSKYALENLEKRRLKLTRLAEVNDPFEFNAVAFLSRTDRLSWQRLGKLVWADKAMICFSDRWSNPLLWSHYADNHRGACLGFDVPLGMVTQVRYVSRRIIVPSLSDVVRDADENVIIDALTVKFSHWRYETEWRAFLRAEASTKSDNVTFEPFGDNFRLAEVILGEASELTSQDIRARVAADIPVHTARRAFRSFQIVHQKLKKMQK